MGSWRLHRLGGTALAASMSRPIAALVALTVVLAGSFAGAASTDAGEEAAEPIDEAWLSSTYDELHGIYGDRLVDVGIATEPVRHVAVLFDGPTPEDIVDLHPGLEERSYDVSDAQPLTHGPIMPVMLRTAQDVPDQIRPGSWMVAPFACTLAHIVEDGSGDLYALTAGHCVDTDEPRSQDIGRTVEIQTAAGMNGRARQAIGSVVDFENEGVGDDYALVDIDSEDEDIVDPNMVGWNGPTGVAETEEPGTVHHYGFGSGATWAHDATRCRTGATLGFWGSKAYGFAGLVAFGDSGSPAQTASGKALGINTHLGFSFSGNNLGTRTTEAIDSLETRTGLSLSLVGGAAQASTCQFE